MNRDQETSEFVKQVEKEYHGEGLVTINLKTKEVLASGTSCSELMNELKELNYDPDDTLTLRCFED